MSETKKAVGFTPGPWVAVEHPSQIGRVFCIGRAERIEKGHGYLVLYDDQTTLNPQRNGEAEATAKLVACAPEMGEMLSSIFAHVSHGGPTRAEGEALLRKAGLIA